MKKLKLILCCIPIFLCCGMYYSARPLIPPSRIAVPRVQASAGYWLYFRLEDRLAILPREAAGRSKKGDLVQVLPVDRRSIPTVTEQQEWSIIKVDSISSDDITTFTSAWDTVIVGRDTTLAFRRWIFDVDSLSISKGLDTTKVPWIPVKEQSIRKTSAMLLEYERKCKIIRYQQYVLAPIEKVLNWVVRPLFATEQITTCNRSGETYNTIVLWEDAEDGTMTTGDPDVLEVYDDDGILSNSTRVDIDGWTNNDATTQIIVRPATGEGHTGTDSTGFQRLNTGGSASIFVRESFTIIDGLDLNNGAQAGACIDIFDGTDIHIRNNLLWNGTNIGISVSTGADSANFVYNNVVYDFATGIQFSSTDLQYIYNNTVYNSSSTGIRAQSSSGNDSTLVSNNAVFNSSVNDYHQSDRMKVGSTNNASDDATADDNALLNGIINLTDTNEFTSPAQPSSDFSVLDNTANIYNAGDDLSAVLTDDIIGTSRPQATTYDIGAFELIVVSGGTPAAPKKGKPFIFGKNDDKNNNSYLVVSNSSNEKIR